ncbi:Uncharacterized protein FKW44_024171, partial [Caligus rogercresseyi]
PHLILLSKEVGMESESNTICQETDELLRKKRSDMLFKETAHLNSKFLLD